MVVLVHGFRIENVSILKKLYGTRKKYLTISPCFTKKMLNIQSIFEFNQKKRYHD